MRSWRPRTVRARLAWWYATTMAAVLAAFAASVFLFVHHVLSQELTERLHDDFEAAEGRLETAGGQARIKEEAHSDHQDEIEPWIEIWTTDARPLARTVPASTSAVGITNRPSSDYHVESVVDARGEHLRTMMREVKSADSNVVVRVARSEEPMRHELRELVIGIIVTFPLAIGLAAIAGAGLARRALQPIDRMARHARTITAERLHDRLPVDNPNDELGTLASVFNETLGRLERSFDQLRRFTADASHELRTPLTAMRSVGEVGLSESHDAEGYRDIIGSMLEEVTRLTRLVDTLLTLSRADDTPSPIHLEQVELSTLARDVTGDLAVLAEEKHQRILVEAPAPVFAHVDRFLLSEALINLVDNAVKYSPDGAAIRVVVRTVSNFAQIDVIDQGPGIAAEHRERIFDRFYRIDKSRSRPGGTGLGLSIAQWAVQANGGRLELVNSTSAGSTFRISVERLSGFDVENHR